MKSIDVGQGESTGLVSGRKNRVLTLYVTGAAIFLLICVAIAVLVVFYTQDTDQDGDSDGTSLGDGMWSSFTVYNSLPTTTAEAVASGWFAISGCQAGLGILYSKESTGPSPTNPLCLRFTEYGQMTGVQVSVYGVNSIGNAAQQNLLDLGYWKVNPFNTSAWMMDITFRASKDVCSTSVLSEPIGDRIVINQDTIAKSIELKRKVAQNNGWTPGSCMNTMGQHHFYDLSVHPEQSYVEDQLLPVVPMYWPLDDTGTINAFFVATPVAQPGNTLGGAADWEPSALVPLSMCQNWCDDANCNWATPAWGTMHIFLNSQWPTIVCPNGVAPVGRSCDFS